MHWTRGYRLRNRSRLDIQILGYKEAAVTHTNVAEVGRRGHHLDSKLTTRSIGYTVHLMHAVGTWHFEGENLRP